ncbi:hypothetical protein PVAG01_03248 [Phlyctema vagabunda]|uniref:Wax synthase domain-containing protein n=1 Tax=Phlyctema vagabunda TaxID=108571 RepID=A0ABR4PTI8_9HELO
MARPSYAVILALLCLTTFGVKSLYLFSMSNGLFEIFGHVLETDTLPDNVPLKPITTHGWSSKIDWQIKAPAAFCWSFAGDGTHPDTTLSGLLFVGTWGPAWLLIVLESLRRGNRWRIVSFDSIWGVLVFNHSHAVVTPLYFASHLFTSPVAIKPTADDVLIDAIDLFVIPPSFLLGYVVPIILIALPAPALVSLVFKQTVMGWYQQWNLFISIIHFLLASITRNVPVPCTMLNTESRRCHRLRRTVYAFAFIMGAVPHWIVCVISFTAGIWPQLFNPSISHRLHPSHLLVPTCPFSDAKVADLAQGFMWLIQWDYTIGTAASISWAAAVYRRARPGYNRVALSWKILKYTLAGGPVGAAVGLIWERDEFLLSRNPRDLRVENTERCPLLQH